jgi:hypothetical protein
LFGAGALLPIGSPIKQFLKSAYDAGLKALPERLAFRMLSVLSDRYRIRSVVMETADGILLLRSGWVSRKPQ